MVTLQNISINKKIESVVNDYSKNKETINELKQKILSLKRELKELIDNNQEDDKDIIKTFDKNQLLIKQQNQINNKIQYFTDKLFVLENNTDELDFYSSDGNFLKTYYNDYNNPTIIKKTKNNNKITNNEKTNDGNILNFFTLVDETTLKDPLNNVQIKNNIEKQYNNYLNNKTSNIFKCKNCGNEKINIYIDGYAVCYVCGEIDEHYTCITEHDKYNNIEKTVYPYKRLNHFIEWLNQFQAKETTNVPKDVYDKIIKELKNTGTNDLSTLTIETTKSILKKYKLHRYYEHVSYITSQISGIHPPILDYETEEYLKQTFKKIEKSFNKNCPNNRTNFISYSYVLHKIFQIHGKQDVLIYFPLLKSREKLKSLDKIWQCICKDLGWKFYSSF